VEKGIRGLVPAALKRGTAAIVPSAANRVQWLPVGPLGALRREAARWADALETPRDVSEVEADWMAGSVTHLAYHLGAIRQIDRASRGPTAEDEARAQA